MPCPTQIARETRKLRTRVKGSRANGASSPLASAGVYQQLRALARRYAQGNQSPSLQPADLVHEAYLRLAGGPWRDRAHFCAVAARTMRHILIDRARRRRAAKRGGGWEQVTLSGLAAGGATSAVDALTLEDALTRLEALDPRRARIVELRFFGGLTTGEIAEHLEVSTSTVEKEWRGARAWLKWALSHPESR
jgi:RNA polymerase sigma factor (TIGR02999 family)